MTAIPSKVVCIVGPRAKGKRTVTGVALALELLIDHLESNGIHHLTVDTVPWDLPGNSGAFSIRRCMETLSAVCKASVSIPRCDILYSTVSTSPLGFVRDAILTILASLLGKRIVLHLHGGGFSDFASSRGSIFRKLIERVYLQANEIIVLAETLKSQFSVLPDECQDRVSVVPNGLSHGTSDPGDISRSLGEPVTLLYLSSLMPSKGYTDALDAMKILEASEPGKFHLHLCGHFVSAVTEVRSSISDEGELLSYLKKYRLENAVTYHGQVVGEEKARLFRESCIFLLPTYYPWEGQPLSIIEALAYSMPVVSCRHKGIPEMVSHGENGLFVNPRSPEEIAEAIKQIGIPGRFESMSKSARKVFEESFQREVHLENLMNAVFQRTRN